MNLTSRYQLYTTYTPLREAYVQAQPFHKGNPHGSLLIWEHSLRLLCEGIENQLFMNEQLTW